MKIIKIFSEKARSCQIKKNRVLRIFADSRITLDFTIGTIQMKRFL